MTPTQTKAERPHHLWGRRDLLTLSGWIGIGVATVASLGGFVRLLFRRAPVLPPTTFKANKPTDYGPNTVSSTFLAEWRVFLVRSEGRLFALHAKCTHLGCTPRWYATDKKFKCPCHGSGFTVAGVNFEGPAPRPLDRAKIWLGDDGEVRVDVGQRFPAELWDLPGASLPIEGEGDA